MEPVEPMEPMKPTKSMEKLIPAVAQDWKTGEVLMLAYMNDEALQKTQETGIAHYWSRSRKRLWLKGESSGHFQRIKEIRLDCDGDALLLLVEQEGGACHTGYRSCFYRTIDGKIVGEKVFEPDDVY
jgi:phosphoribosyl-AMP cyclohydrolase